MTSLIIVTAGKQASGFLRPCQHIEINHQMPDAQDRFTAKIAGIATVNYIQAHHHLPDAARWENAIKPYWPKNVPFNVTLKAYPGHPHRRLAMNRNLSDVRLDKIDNPSNTVLYFETNTAQRNASGLPPSSILAPHSGRTEPVYVCVDGRYSNS
jgi:hypothetical protein